MIRITPTRIMALGVIAAQILFCSLLLPPSERWFLHPDDYESYVFAQAITDEGVPLKPYHPSPYTRYSAFEPASALIKDDTVVTNRPPGLYYLLAPGTFLGFDATNALFQLSIATTMVFLFLLLERIYSERAALLGLALFAFSAPVLFWGQFFFGNVPALGVLFAGILLMTYDSPMRRLAGAFVVMLSLLFRFEYALIIAPLALGWLVLNLPFLRTHPRRYVYPFVGATFGLLFVFGLALILYDTVNLVGVTVRQPTVARSIVYTAGAVKTSNLERNYVRFVAPLLLVPIALFPAPFLYPRRPHWPIPFYLAGTAGLLWFFLGNSFSAQRFFMAHSYVRYIIPACAAGAFALAHLVEVSGRKGIAIAAAVAVVVTGAVNLDFVAGPAGFEPARDYFAIARAHVEDAKELPGPAVFVGEHLGKMLLDVPILVPQRIPAKVRENETMQIVHRLLENGTHVYVSSTFGPEYREWAQRQPDLELVRVTPRYFEVRLAGGGA